MVRFWGRWRGQEIEREGGREGWAEGGWPLGIGSAIVRVRRWKWGEKKVRMAGKEACRDELRLCAL